MADPFVRRVGGVLSADIAVPEHEHVVRFYTRVLTTGEDPLWRKDLLNNHGMPVIGVGPRSAEYAHLPLQWMPHIQVADVSTSVNRALDLNGGELLHAKAADGKSQWAVLLDPNGAAFGIIPIVPEEAIRPPDDADPADAGARVGCVSWRQPVTSIDRWWVGRCRMLRWRTEASVTPTTTCSAVTETQRPESVMRGAPTWVCHQSG
jgi:predicted enzyme related to lactoylglutathione lyase